MTWYSWIGKPHGIGSDPTTDDTCDCLVMVTRVREWMGLAAPNPGELRELVALARVEDTDGIKQKIAIHLDPVNHPTEGVFTILESPGQLGTAVVVEGGLLSVHHKHGVRWTASRFIRNLDWYHWK